MNNQKEVEIEKIDLNKLLTNDPKQIINCQKLSKEELQLIKSLTLSIEINPNFGKYLPDTSNIKSKGNFDFKEKHNPSSMIAVHTLSSYIIIKKGEIVVQKRDKRFIDCAAGKNCYFLCGAYNKGIFKTSQKDSSPPTQIYQNSPCYKVNGIQLLSSSDRKLLFFNADDGFVMLVLKNDKIFSKINFNFWSDLEPFVDIRRVDYLFFGADTFLALLHIDEGERVFTRLGVAKFSSDNRKVLSRKVFDLDEYQQIDSISACPDDQYLCCVVSYYQKGAGRHPWGTRRGLRAKSIEIFKLSKGLSTLQKVARCKLNTWIGGIRVFGNILDYVGMGRRFGLVLVFFGCRNDSFSYFSVYLLDTIERRLSSAVSEGRMEKKSYKFNGVVKLSQKKAFVLTNDLEFISFELLKTDSASELTQTS